MTKWIRVKCLETINRQYLKKNKWVSAKKALEDIALLRLDAIGDFILWLDSAQEYRKLFPKARIVLICNKCNMIIAEKLDMFDEVISVSMDRFSVEDVYKKEIENSFKSLHFKTLIQTAYSRTIEMDILAAMIPAAKKIAMEADESKNNLSRFIVRKSTREMADAVYSRLIVSDNKQKMELIRNADFVRRLGKADFKADIFHLPVIENHVVLPEREYFLVFPGASSQKRQWAPDKYAHVIKTILRKTEYCGVLCGAEKESGIAEEVIKKAYVIETDRLLNKAGKTTLLELIEYIRNAAFVITNDTSGVHFAAATGTPAVCIAGEHHKGRFLPYQLEKPEENKCLPIICNAGMKCAGCSYTKRDWRCLWNIVIRKHFLCVEKVEVSAVEKAVQSILDKV